MLILEEIFYSDFGKTQLNNMKKTLILVIFVFVGAAIIFYRSNVKKELAYKEQIKDLNSQIKAKEDSINAYREQVDIFVDKVHRAEMQLEENQTKIKKIYKEYEVHLLSIDSYDIDELERFFSNRYKDSTSTEQ
jgi:peptidoglycan hydrolase CwlO-like protein